MDASVAHTNSRPVEGEAKMAVEPTRHELPPPSDPMSVARALLAERHTVAGTLTLRHWRGQWWRWEGDKWVEVEDREVRAEAYGFTEHAFYMTAEEPRDWDPTRSKIINLLEAMMAIVHLPADVAQPSWLDDTEVSGAVVSCANGLLEVQSRELRPHSPAYFNGVSVPFDYDPDALDAERWAEFLEGLWGEDVDQVKALQEWFGYVISGRTDHHKILLIVGPTRAGKGVICRLLMALVGRQNVAGPTLSSLRGDFGLQPLLGKPLAVVSDARLTGRDSNLVVERLLSVSGEDTITVNRKYKDQWTGKLPSRFMICSNELPSLGDASGAIAGRFVTLLLERSFLGKEDLELERALHRELGGVLNWALDGLTGLETQGRFTTPAASEVAYQTLLDLASPVSAFLRDQCHTGVDLRVTVAELWGAWKRWCEDNGHPHRSKQIFGRDLRAAVPTLRMIREGGRGAQHRIYVGIGLRTG
jgi:putative DNA primase/helicase